MQEPPGSERRPSSAHPQIFGDAFTADHKVLSEENESRLRSRGGGTFSLIGSKVTQRKNCAGNSDVCKSSCRMIKTQVLLTQMILWSLFALVKTDVGVTTSQPPADEKLVELQETH